jgi:hypothetical protein
MNEGDVQTSNLTALTKGHVEASGDATAQSVTLKLMVGTLLSTVIASSLRTDRREEILHLLLNAWL